jgi:phosphate transport system substrate-binding protein
MRPSLPLRVAAPFVLAATLGAACSSSSKSSSSSSSAASAATTPTTAAAPSVTGTLNGDGSTLQANYEAAAVDAFTKANHGTTINYNPVGSGQGQSDLAAHNVDFAGSDVAIASSTLPKFNGATVLYFPIVADPVTVPYNLSGVSKLDLSGPTLAKIFAGTVKYWNDPTIAADNPGAKLPHTAITVVHRSDSSGTTGNFTKFLVKAGGSAWTLGSATTVSWPSSETAAKGNAGVAQAISQTDGAVGYVDYSDTKDAGSLATASIKNVSGTFVAPSVAGASAALAQATVSADLTYDPINAAGADVYPITSPTYILVLETQTNPQKAALLKAYIGYILSAAGQALATANNYAPLSSNLDQQATAQLDKIGM